MTPTIFYDGTCRFCIAQATRLKRMTQGRVAFESAYAPGVRERFPMLPAPGADGKLGEMKFVDAHGAVFGGAAAIASALTLRGGLLGLGARVYWLPPITWLANRAYRFVSKRRYRMQGTCEDGSCQV
jgi:predicted DCC family thiol-disulfide oxidoreductase YuxK